MADDNGNIVSGVDPKKVRRVHLVGVAGTGMGSFAGMLKAAGFEVTGSDENVYPPMSDMLKAWGIQALTPYAPGNLDVARPDLAIIGNVIRRVNPEATAIRERAIPQMSFPAALGELFLKTRHSIVVAGTHGKTTSSALMSHVLVEAGRDPSFLVGGVTQNYSGNYRLGMGAHFVVEGDEYDTAYFDKGPKFLHYQPRTCILTSVEFDHADIYRDMAHYESSFEKLVALIPADGNLVVSVAYPNAVAIARRSKAKLITYSGREGADAEYVPRKLHFGPEGARFEVMERGKSLGEVVLPLSGAHNVENSIGVIAASRALGLSSEEIRKGLATFQGVKRRQEVRGEIHGVMVVDDFAHHPTAVRETIAGVYARYAGRRLWAVFEPRSNTSRRNIHQEEYARSFDGAALATLKIPERHDKIPTGEELDVPRLCKELTAHGIPADCDGDVGRLVERVSKGAKSGDVILVMSNGSFGGFIDKLLAALAAGAVALGCAARVELPDYSDGSAMGERVEFKLPARDGRDGDLAKDRGNVVLVDVWATWSDPCKDALPLDQALQKEYGERGLRVYTVNVDRDLRFVDQFLEVEGVSVPVLLDRDAKVTDRILHVKQMPTSFLLDRQGVVRYVHEGFTEGQRAGLRSEIDELLAEPKPE